MEKKIIDSLKLLGLTKNESIAYITLNALISGSATKISETSIIPRSKVYDVLKSLYKKGFIEIEIGKPTTYHIIPANQIFEKHKNRIIQNLDETELELTNLYEDQLSKVQAPIWLIHGENRIIAKELEIIARTKHVINLRLGFLFQNEAKQLIKGFNKLSSDIQINLLVSNHYSINDTKIDIMKEFKNTNVNILKAELPFVKMIVRDGQEMMHIYIKFSDKNKEPIHNTAIGVWNQYEDIAKNYEDRFFQTWHKKKKKQ